MTDQNPLQTGLECLKAGNVDAAIPHLEQACAETPDDYRCFNFLGVAYAQKKWYDKAIGALQAAAQMRGDIPSIHYNLGLAYSADGFPDQAKEQFERALQIDPNYDKAKEAIRQIEQQAQSADDGQCCARHTDAQAVGHCSFCHLPVCKECRTEMEGHVYCKPCAAKLQQG